MFTVIAYDLNKKDLFHVEHIERIEWYYNMPGTGELVEDILTTEDQIMSYDFANYGKYLLRSSNQNYSLIPAGKILIGVKKET